MVVKVWPGGAECRELGNGFVQDGIKLDLNRLAHRGFIRRGARSGPIGIRWISTNWGEEIASGTITADIRRPSPTFRRPTMVFHVLRHEPASVGTMEATGRKPVLESSGLGGTSCLRLAVQRPG